MSASLSRLSRRTFLALSGAAVGSRALSSFAATSNTSPASTGVLPTFPRASSLDAADLTALTGDEQCLLVSLQGQVNRKQPRLYFFLSSDGSDQVWLNTLTVPRRVSTEPWEFLAKYRSEIRGAVVYDVNVPDTVNVATAIASMRGGVICTADLAKAHQLNVIEDLTGEFANGMAAYQWAFDNLWPKMPQRILTAITPTNSVQVANVQWTTLLQVTQPITDGSNKAVYTADLTPFLTSGGAVYVRWTDAYPNDGWGPSVDQVTVTADGNAIASFQPGGSGETPYVFDLDSSQTASLNEYWVISPNMLNHFALTFTRSAANRLVTGGPAVISAVTVGCVPQAGQSGFLRSFSVRNCMLSASTSSKRPTSVSPMPRISLITSVAWMTPTSPGRMPSTPPSAHEGTRPGGGGSGYKQR